MKSNKALEKLMIPFFVASFILASNASAQNATEAKHAYGGMGYFQTGCAFINQGNLNDLLKASGMPELENRSLSFGGGGHAIIHNFIIGGEGHGLIGNTSENAHYMVSQSGGYGFFNLGYLLLQKSSFTLYPILGIGGEGSSVTITDKSSLPNTFSDLMANPNHQSTLNKGGFMLNFSIGSDYFFSGSNNGNSVGGFLLGLRVGYLLELNQNSWDIAGQELSGAPDAGISGPFVRLTFGGGGIAK